MECVALGPRSGIAHVPAAATAAVVVVVGNPFAGGSHRSPSQDPCDRTVASLSNTLAANETVTRLDKKLATAAVTTCQSRRSFADAAARYDLVSKLGRLPGMYYPRTGDSRIANSSDALNYLCGKYQPHGGTRACNDFSG